jgi:hypothetical protein
VGCEGLRIAGHGVSLEDPRWDEPILRVVRIGWVWLVHVPVFVDVANINAEQLVTVPVSVEYSLKPLGRTLVAPLVATHIE